MGDEERRKKEEELKKIWYNMIKQIAPPPTSVHNVTACEAPLDLKTKRKSSKSIKILEDKIINNVPDKYVPPNVYIETNLYEPISPPESCFIIDDVDPHNTTDSVTEATTTVQEEVSTEQTEFHVLSHEQYLEYLKLKKHFETIQDETTATTQDLNESDNDNRNHEKNNLSYRDRKIQELIGKSDEYKSYLLSILNQQQVDATVSTNAGQEDLQTNNRGVPDNMPNNDHNNNLYAGEKQMQTNIMTADLNAMSYANVPYASQAPREKYFQNKQAHAQTQTNQFYTVNTRGYQQSHTHTHNQQQRLPYTYVPSARRLSGAVTDSFSLEQHISDTNVHNIPQQRWDAPVDRHQPYQQKVSSQIYTENETNPIILIQKVPSPVLLSGQQQFEQNIPGGRVIYPERTEMFSDPVELRSEYYDPAVLNYQPQRCNEPVIPSAQQQSYSEEIVPNCQQKVPEVVRRRSRQQRLQQETLIPHQHQIYSDGVPQNIEHIRCPDPYVMENQQRIYSEQIKKLSQQQGYHIVPPENPQQYPVHPTCQYARSYNPEVLNSQPYSVSNCQQCRHSVPSAPYAQQQACNEPTTKSTKPKAQIKKKYQRRKDTSQTQDPASLLWQQHSSPQSQPQQNNQATNTQQYAVPPQMVRRVAQPAMIPEPASQTVRPIHEQVPEYYQQYYNQHHENPHACKDQNHHHHPYKNP